MLHVTMATLTLEIFLRSSIYFDLVLPKRLELDFECYNVICKWKNISKKLCFVNTTIFLLTLRYLCCMQILT